MVKITVFFSTGDLDMIGSVISPALASNSYGAIG